MDHLEDWYPFQKSHHDSYIIIAQRIMGHPTSMVDVVRGLVVNLVDVGVQKRCLFEDNVKRTVKLAPPNKQNSQAIQREGPVAWSLFVEGRSFS